MSGFVISVEMSPSRRRPLPSNFRHPAATECSSAFAFMICGPSDTSPSATAGAVSGAFALKPGVIHTNETITLLQTGNDGGTKRKRFRLRMKSPKSNAPKTRESPKHQARNDSIFELRSFSGCWCLKLGASDGQMPGIRLF